MSNDTNDDDSTEKRITGYRSAEPSAPDPPKRREEFPAREAEKAAFSSPIPSSSDPVQRRRDDLRDEVAVGNAEAAEKLLGINDPEPNHGRAAKALEKSDEDAPEWALSLLDAVEANTEAINELADDKAKAHEVFTR